MVTPMFIVVAGLCAVAAAITAFALLRPPETPTGEKQARIRDKAKKKENGSADGELLLLLEQAGSNIDPDRWRANRVSRSSLYAVAGAVAGGAASFMLFGATFQIAVGGALFGAMGGWMGWFSYRSALRTASKKRAEAASGQLVEVGALMAQRLRAKGTAVDAIESAVTIASDGVLRTELEIIYNDHLHNQTPLPKCFALAQRRIDNSGIHDLYRALSRNSDLDARVEEIVRRMSAARAGESDERIQSKTGPLNVKAGTLRIFAGTVVLGGFPVTMAVASSLQGGVAI